MAAPSSARDDPPESAYIPPMIQTPMNSQALGSALAMSPGVRTIPAPMALPMAAAMPNHMPSTWRRRPRSCEPDSAALEDESGVMDKEFHKRTLEAAIILALREIARRKGTMRADGPRDLFICPSRRYRQVARRARGRCCRSPA